ncbi:stage II sporulation protein M [Paenibacillus sp. MBLB4367]|uniref:stage II sporulation protein M n=1 Tax=Paenibacillus sp. MBLB4367 TaxID=3384767 RepID=UPI003908142E
MGLSVWYAHLRSMKREIIVSFIIFAIGMYLGYSKQFPSIVEGQMSNMKGIAEAIQNMKYPQLWMFVFIFVNNVVLSLLVMYLGAFFAIAPVYFLIMNGLVLGYLASTQVNADNWFLFVKGIVPHGIIEIPVVIIACAYGIRFGTIATESLISFPFAQRRARAAAKLVGFMKVTIPFMLVLASSLLLAAIIESTISYWLIR